MGAILIRFLYKKSTILLIIKKLISFQSNQINFIITYLEHTVYYLTVRYIKKLFVDYLDPNFINQISIASKKDNH